MKYFFNLMLVLYSVIAGSAEPEDSVCNKECICPFGSLNGRSFQTEAYSNCNGDCVKNEDNFVGLKESGEKIYTGMRWQCVEYSRRWLIENKQVTFADVEYAYQIWDLKFAEKVGTHEQIPFFRYKNKISNEAPKVGDLLIYSKKLATTGHVAVIVGVYTNSITIAEQNYFNQAWEGKDYARRLLLEKDRLGRYRIFDDAVIGWIRART